MNDCIFCKIIKGELPSKTVYEDELIKVIMNINPATDGHLLVLPKKHYTNILDVDDKVLMHSITTIREKIYPKVKEALGCEGLTIAENNELGQEIKHFHIHLIPRYPDDNADFNYDKSKLHELDEVFEKLSK
ncbi:MAG: HIT domain-containing protein [Bacilli bacterium]|nr:HIT domain-containing protein [Bacilli bacterium]